MKPSAYVILFLLVALLAGGFYYKYSYLYNNLSGEDVVIFWVAVVYMAALAIGVSRWFIWGSFLGAATIFVAWHVFGKMMPEYQMQLALACSLVYGLFFLPANLVQENSKVKTKNLLDTMNQKIGDATAILTS